MTREELRKKRKEIAESNGYKGYTPRSVENGTRRDMTETRNPEPVQEKKSTWTNVMNAVGKIGDTMSYIGGGEQNKFSNVNRLVRNDYFTRDINPQKNTSLQQDVKEQAKIAGLSLKKSGLGILNYIENATLNNSPEYRNVETQRGIQKAIQEGKAVITIPNEKGIPTISSDISVTPSKDAINKSMDETENKIQTLTERQNNPVTRKFSELLPSITQSVTGMGASLINPALRTSILANICWRRLYKTS